MPDSVFLKSLRVSTAAPSLRLIWILTCGLQRGSFRSGPRFWAGRKEMSATMPPISVGS